MQSMEGFARAEIEKWKGRILPLDIEQVDSEIERRQMLEAGE